MKWLCECRGPCRRTFDIPHDVYSYLARMGTVVVVECAEREQRTPVHHHRVAGLVVVGSIRHTLADSARHRLPTSL